MNSDIDVNEEYTNLKKHYINLKQEHEKTIQELHESKRTIKSLEYLQQECQNEIDLLQSEEIKQKQKYQEIIKQLENQINTMRANHNDEKQTLENAIMQMADKNEMLQSRLNDFKECSNHTTFIDTTNIIEEILSEEPRESYENQELKKNVNELKQLIDSMRKKEQEYVQEIGNLKESYEYKRNELLETVANNQALTDENLCVKLELDSLKNQPLNKDSKGNSLFAEVDDRRVYLQDKISKMKSSYEAITKEKAQLENVIHQLKLNNLRLIEQWKKDIDEIEEDEDEVLCSLKVRIKNLEALVEKYKKEIAAKPVVISKKNFEEYEYFELVLKEKNQEIESLRTDLIKKSLMYISFADDIKQAHEEKRKWKLDAMEKQHELELLRKSNYPEGEVTKICHGIEKLALHHKGIKRDPENKENLDNSVVQSSLGKNSWAKPPKSDIKVESSTAEKEM